MVTVLICDSNDRESEFREALGGGRIKLVFLDSKHKAKETRPFLNPKLIVVDAWLKGSGGTEERPDIVRQSANLVREFYKSHPEIPIIATGLGSSDRETLMNAGATLTSDSMEETIRLIEHHIESIPDTDDDD